MRYMQKFVLLSAVLFSMTWVSTASALSDSLIRQHYKQRHGHKNYNRGCSRYYKYKRCGRKRYRQKRVRNYRKRVTCRRGYYKHRRGCRKRAYVKQRVYKKRYYREREYCPYKSGHYTRVSYSGGSILGDIAYGVGNVIGGIVGGVFDGFSDGYQSHSSYPSYSNYCDQAYGDTTCGGGNYY